MTNVYLSYHTYTTDESAGRDEDSGRAFDGVEGGFDAIIVEVDFDSLPVDERPKRQLSLSGILGLFIYLFFFCMWM
jgi:hypothetical protein